MVDVDILDDAKRLVADLRARGDEHNAQVIEQLIVATGTSASGSAIPQSPDRLSFRQAARALNVRIETIKNWVATGKVRAVVINGQELVDRSSLLAYLKRLRVRRAPNASEPGDETTRRELLSLVYPGDTLQRLRELLDARQERSLTAEERAELDHLEEVSQRVSATRLREWVRQREGAAFAGDGQEEGFGRSGLQES